ncbi:hypothetical protein [Stenotrophomonas riyadhensis]|uniref:hypothetical protein n=1 Tax=Stenotrophomonas riyadhensis TaxID=2859893 RepID=UPI0033067E44
MDRDIFVVLTMAFGFGVLTSWGLFYVWGSAPQPKTIDLAAWTQAIGSILAICLAIYVPWRQRRYQLDDQRERAAKEDALQRQLVRAMHTALFAPIERHRTSCARTLECLNESVSVRQKRIREDMFDRSPEIDQFRASLHLMGEIGHEINILISDQDVLRGMLRNLRGPTITPENLKKARQRLEKGSKNAERIRAKLAKVAVGKDVG